MGSNLLSLTKEAREKEVFSMLEIKSY